MTPRWTSGGVLSALLALAGAAGAANLCPTEIETRQTLVNPPTGFEAADDRLDAHRLTYVEVFDGPYKDRASLVPDEQSARVARWRFGAETQRRGVEIACHYARTRVVLVRPIVKDAKACAVTYRPKAEGTLEGQVLIASFECR